MVRTERISPERTYGSTQSMRIETTHRNLKLVHVPIHTSWLKQIEIYFSVLQRKVLTAADYDSLSELQDGIVTFQTRTKPQHNRSDGSLRELTWHSSSTGCPSTKTTPRH